MSTPTPLPPFRSGPPPVPLPQQVLGPRAPEPHHHHRGRRTWQLLAAAFGLLLLAALSLVVVGFVVAETGPVAFLIGTTVATVPVPLVVAALLWVDRHEPEPRSVLLLAFAWGAVIAALASALVNTTALLALAQTTGDLDASSATTAVVVAPIVEEATKGLGVLAFLLLRRRGFDGVVDGIVTAGMVGVGFAFTENILYFGRAYLEGEELAVGGGAATVGVTFVLRGVFSPFAHPLFTAMIGIGIGIASQTRSLVLRLLAPAVGFLLAVLLHGAWNLAAVAGFEGFVAGYLLVQLPVFLGVAGIAGWVSSRERVAIARTLPAYAAAGWLPPYDVAMVATTATRRRARRWARTTQGPAAERAMADYQGAAAELALLRDRAGRGLRVPGFAEHEEALLVDLARARSGFLPVLR